MSQPTVAVVILNYNGKHHLQTFLPSVLASRYAGLRVVVADNASTDGSMELVEQLFPSVERLYHTRNEGFAGGYNWALSHVEADYFVLLNSDVEVTPDWIEPVIALMETDPAIAACQPKVLSYHQPHLFEYAGAAGGWMDVLGYPFSRGRVFDVCEADEGQYNDPQPVFWATGAAMFVRAAVWQEMGGLDARFFAHQEEIDLCWRMQLSGYRIMSCPASVVYHVGGGTLPRGGRKVYLNFRNNLLMMGKNLPLGEKLWKLPLRFLLDGVSAWKGLLTGDKGFFQAIVKAHWHVVRDWISGGATPGPVHKKPMKSLTGVYHGSVVWQYFISKRQRFQEIIQRKIL